MPPLASTLDGNVFFSLLSPQFFFASFSFLLTYTACSLVVRYCCPSFSSFVCVSVYICLSCTTLPFPVVAPVKLHPHTPTHTDCKNFTHMDDFKDPLRSCVRAPFVYRSAFPLICVYRFCVFFFRVCLSGCFHMHLPLLLMSLGGLSMVVIAATGIAPPGPPSHANPRPSTLFTFATCPHRHAFLPLLSAKYSISLSGSFSLVFFFCLCSSLLRLLSFFFQVFSFTSLSFSLSLYCVSVFSLFLFRFSPPPSPLVSSSAMLTHALTHPRAHVRPFFSLCCFPIFFPFPRHMMVVTFGWSYLLFFVLFCPPFFCCCFDRFFLVSFSRSLTFSFALSHALSFVFASSVLWKGEGGWRRNMPSRPARKC